MPQTMISDNFGKRMRDFFMKLTRQRADDKIIFPNNLDGFGLAFNDGQFNIIIKN